MLGRLLPLGLAIALLITATPALGDHVPPSLEVSDETIAEPVKPLGDPAKPWLDVSVPCQDDERATVFTQATPREAPEFVDVESASVENRSTEVCHDANDTLEVGLPVEIGLTQKAPAFQPTTVGFDVHVQKNHTNGTTSELGPVQANVTLTPGYFNLFNARLETKIAEAGPDEAVTFPLTIENFSNGPTEFTFRLTNEEAIPEGFEPVVPSKIVLESNATGGTKTSATVKVQVFTPYHNGYVSEIGALQLTVDSAYAPDPSIEGSSAQVSTMTKVNGFYIPGPGVAALLATLAGVGVVLGRARVRR